jgi:hypothetical protein
LNSTLNLYPYADRSRMPDSVGPTGYGVRVTAAAASRPEPGLDRSPFADGSPAQVRAALISEDVAKFDHQWQRVMATATQTLDLTGVHRTLESWRRVAWLTTANGAEKYRQILARAEHTLRTGELPPDSVPLDEIKAMIAERLR